MAKTTTLHKITDCIQIYLQENSTRWLARFKIGSKWYMKTTSTADRDLAVIRAIELNTEYKIMLDNNIPVFKSKRAKRNSFGELARNATVIMEAAIEDGTAKSAYKHYIAVLKNHIVPFFDKTPVKDIDRELLIKFDKWRVDKMGKVPAKSTINMHNSAMNYVFEQAVIAKSIKEQEVPKLKNSGVKGERRAYFTVENYMKTILYIKKWKDQTDKPKTRKIRSLLYYYAEVAIRTGMRPGTEMKHIRWSDIKQLQIKNKTYTTIDVREGKTSKHTGIRRIICNDEVRALLTEYKATLGEVKDSDLVFALSDGANMNILSDNFRILLRKLGIQDTGQGKLTLYSLRHSYITWELQKGTDISVIATQCGTSAEMIHKHYSHIVPTMFADQLSGRNDETPLTQHRRNTENKVAVEAYVNQSEIDVTKAVTLNTIKLLESITPKE